jgi:hypothetical protein
MHVRNPRSYRSPVRKKNRTYDYIFSPDDITKRFIHWRGFTHPDTDRNVETLSKARRRPMVCLAVRIQGACRIRDVSFGVYGILLDMQP